MGPACLGRAGNVHITRPAVLLGFAMIRVVSVGGVAEACFACLFSVQRNVTGGLTVLIKCAYDSERGVVVGGTA